MPLRRLTLFVGLLAVTSASGQPPVQKSIVGGPAIEAEIVQIKRECNEIDTKYHDIRREAGNDSAKIRAASKNYNAERRPVVLRMNALIQHAGKDPAALEGFRVMLEELNVEPHPDTVKVIRQHHLDDPRMGLICHALGAWSNMNWVEDILKDVAGRHPHAATRGQAEYALGEYCCDRAHPRFSAKPLPEEEEARWLAEAAWHYEEVLKTYAAVMTPDGKAKLADRAAARLAFIKNVPFLKVGKPAPEIAGEDIDGVRLKLSDSRGRVTLLVFWASWCPLCMAAVPHERELVERYKDRPFALIGVNGDGEREMGKKAVERERINWRSFWNGKGGAEGEISTAWNIQGWPTIYILDTKGVIRYKSEGADEKKIDEMIQTLLKEMAEGR